MAEEKKPPKLGRVALKALELLKGYPAGLTMRQLREMLAETEEQEHFNRRVRELRKHFILEGKRSKDGFVYVLKGEKTAPDDSAISERLRAEVIHAAHGRCQMCGKTIKDDGIKLQADHRIPQSWGGKTARSNLWAICEGCNRGKRNFFNSFDEDEMRVVMAFKSVHERIAQMLRLHLGRPVPTYALEFVANATEQQDDWQKRLRELRYLGLEIEVSKAKTKSGVQASYTLKNWVDIPADHKRRIRDHENRNKGK